MRSTIPLSSGPLSANRHGRTVKVQKSSNHVPQWSNMVVRRASDYKAPGGKLVRVRMEENNGEIESVRISGDFFLVPEDQLSRLEKMLIGAHLKENELKLLIDRFFVATRAKGLGVSPEDFTKAILSATPEEEA